MAFRRAILDIWPGFDPRLGRGSMVPSGEENYAFHQLISLGFRVIYTPAAVVRHHTPSSYEEARAGHLDILAGAGAYLAFLFAEQRQHRLIIGKFLVSGLWGQRRTPSNVFASSQTRLAPRWRELLAAARGAALYASRRLRPNGGASLRDRRI